MERETHGGGDRVYDRDLGDEPSPITRESTPGLYAAIDPSAPVSGHVPVPGPVVDLAHTPEHDWPSARDLIYPALRPVGTKGLSIGSFDREALAAHAAQSHSQPLVDEGPAGLPIVYTIDAGGFDIIVNGDHLMSWGVEPAELRDTAMRNLAAWSETAPWTDEVSGERRLISSDTGAGWDAARILVPDVLTHLAEELGALGRILVGLPERHLLTAGSLRSGDDEFASLFAEFVAEASGGSDEPVDRRVFEIVAGRLVEFTGLDAGA
jgi:hypothetical protein